jgi:hypothetical protein
MAKQRHDETQATSSRTALLVLAAGGLLVAGLVVWALTRTVDTTTGSPASDQTAAVTAPLSATNPAPTATSTTGTAVDDEELKRQIPRIAVEDLKGKWQRKEVTVIDVRQTAAFDGGHIPGALNIPLATVEAQISTIPKDKPIVTYCT